MLISSALFREESEGGGEYQSESSSGGEGGEGYNESESGSYSSGGESGTSYSKGGEYSSDGDGDTKEGGSYSEGTLTENNKTIWHFFVREVLIQVVLSVVVGVTERFGLSIWCFLKFLPYKITSCN